MAVDMASVAEKIFNIIKGRGYTVDMFNNNGERVIDPLDSTWMAVDDPNIVVKIDDSTNTIQYSANKNSGTADLRSDLKELSQKYLMNFDFKTFDGKLSPKSEQVFVSQHQEKEMQEDINQIRKLAGLEEGWWNRKPSSNQAWPGSGWDKSDSRVYEIDFYPPGNGRWNRWMMYSYDEDDGDDSENAYHVNSDNVDDLISYIKYHKLADEQMFFPFSGYVHGVEKMDHEGQKAAYQDVKKLHSLGLATDDAFQNMFKFPPYNRSPESGMQGDMFENWFNRDPQHYSLEWDEVNAEWTLTSSKINDQGGDHSHKKHISSYHVKDIINYVNKHKLDDIGFKRATAYVEDLPRAAGREKRANELKALHKAGIISREDLGIVLQGSDQEETQMENIAEGFGTMTGSSKTSYQGLDNVKLIVKHKAPVNEESRGARSRNIHSIFVQRGEERFKMSENNLKAARAMARHLQMGGETFDSVGSAITEMAAEQRKLSEFARYVTKRGLVNETNEEFVTLAKENVSNIKNTLDKLCGVKSYANAVENIQDMANVEILEDDLDLEAKFTETHFDNRVADAMDSIKRSMNRRNSFESAIRTAIQKESFDNLKGLLQETGVVDFASPQARLSHQVSQMGHAAENPMLRNHLMGISKKIDAGHGLGQFEYDTIKSCLLSAREARVQESNMYESAQLDWENFLEQYDIL